MADPQVKVKFTTDTSALKSGMDQATSDAKQKVKELSDDVSKESKDMEDSLDKVADSAKDIGSAAKSASSGVKDLEKQVTDSSKTMEKSLDAVSRKVTAMNVARGVGNGLGIAGDIVKTFGGGNGTADLVGNALRGAGQGAMSGAMIGSVVPGIGTGIGMAAGALMGAGSELLKAGQELNKAAAAQSTERRNAFKDAVDDLAARRESARVEQENQDYAKGLNTQEGMDRYNAELDTRTKAVNDAQAAYDAFVDQFKYLFDESYTGEKSALTKDEEAELQRLNDALAVARQNLENFAPVVAAAQGILGQRAAEEEAERQKVAMAEAAAAQAQAEDEMEQLIRSMAPEETVEDRKTQERSVRDQLKEAQSELTGSQRELEGVGRTTVGVTDDLTRIGGGAGYASYNNSVGDNVKTISDSLKQLIQLQQSNVDRLVNTLEDIKVTGAGTWGD